MRILGIAMFLPVVALAQQQEETMKIPEVKQAYEQCRQQNSQDIAGCAWNLLSQSAKDTVQSIMNPDSLKGDVSAGASSASSTETEYDKCAKTIPVADYYSDGPNGLSQCFKYNPDKEIEWIVAKKINSEFYGQPGGQTQKVVGHSTYYEMYETELTQGIISVISSYCIEADPSKKYLLSADGPTRDNQKKTNLDNLKQFKVSTPAPQATPDPSAQAATSKNAASEDWKKCMLAVQDICGNVKDYKAKDPAADADYKYSQGRACAVTQSLKNIRQALIKTKEINAAMSASQSAAMAIKNLEVYGSGNNKGTSELLTLTSAEVAASQLATNTQAVVIEMKDCTDPKNVNSASCQKFLTSGDEKKAQDDKNAELDMRTKSISEQLKDPNLSKESVEKILKDEGRSEAEIQAILQNPLNDVKALIAKRYEQERDAINRELQERAKKTSIQSSDTDQTKSSKIDELASELNSKPEKLKDLVHYTNMIQGFLDFTEGGGANSTSIARELANTSGLNQQEIADREILKTSLQGNNIDITTTKNDKSIKIEVENINASALKVDPK